ncbi:MAG: hypothetical protein HYU98_00190, partial [Deltaproteobacteria bacterium]|nr:hypothetical protein [Deltaproteobacteria bacterium]
AAVTDQNPGDKHRLTGITLSRDASCTDSLTINSMSTTTWAPDNGELLNAIEIAGSPTEFSGPAAGSGGTFDFGSNDYTINDAATHNLTYVQWNSDMSGHNFHLVFNFTINAQTFSKSADVNFLAANQAGCFSWTTTSARLSFTSNAWRDLINTSIANSCAQPIRLDKMTVSWTPTTPSRNLTNVQINGGSEEFTGTAASGVQIEVDDLISASSSQTVNYFRFDGDMLGRNYSVVWTFADGTSTTLSLNLFNANENNCLTISTANVAVSGNDVTGLTVENICSADIGMTSVTMTWSGGPANFTAMSIDDVDGTNTYSGTFASGAALDFATVDAVDGNLYYPDGSGVKNINSLSFSSTPAGTTFTITFTTADGTTKAATFTPQTQANCLSVNMLGSSLTNGSKDLSGITTINNCSFPITWAQTTVTTSSTRNLTQIVADGVTIFSGSAGSGVTVDNTDVVYSASQTVSIDRFRFSGSVADKIITIAFIMGDGSTQTAEFSEKFCLVPNTSAATIGGTGGVDLLGITINNQCTARSIIWITTVASWTPTSPTRNLTSIVVDGSSVFSGSMASGGTTNNSNVTLTAGQTRAITRFRFSGDMTGRTFTITFNMQDTSSDTTPSFTPP